MASALRGRLVNVPLLDLSEITEYVEDDTIPWVVERLEHANGFCSARQKLGFCGSLWTFLTSANPSCEMCAQFGGDVSVNVQDLDYCDWNVFAGRLSSKETPLYYWAAWFVFAVRVSLYDARRRPVYLVVLLLLMTQMLYLRFYVIETSMSSR
mmetsp:Transcript_4609/g.9217  ORF Transcript_4609/g.9217 Transcript_4609/m.9217 type:complete len:153 (-) Transcript_4609:414-872(-)